MAVGTKTNISTETTVKDTDCFDTVDISTGTYTAAAQNTFVAVNLDKGVRIINRIMVFDTLVTIFSDIIIIG